jgi:hypothetical protein
MKTDSFCISRQMKWSNISYEEEVYVTTVPTIKVGSVFVYKNNKSWQILHKNGLACFWLTNATKDQAIRWAKRELIQRIGTMEIDLNCSQFTSEIKEEFRELFVYAINWGVFNWGEMPSEFIY